MKPSGNLHPDELEIQTLLLAQQSELGEVGVSISAGCDWVSIIRSCSAMRSLARKGLLCRTLKEVDEFAPVQHLRYKITEEGKQFLHDHVKKT